MSQSIRTAPFLSRAGWRESTVLLAVAALVPFLVHLLPWSGMRPLGVYVLPVFWTTFVAVYFRGVALGLAVGLITPLISVVLTGLPVPASISSMSLEIVFFVPVAVWLVARSRGFRFWAPVAWVVAKAAAIGVQMLIPAFHETEGFLSHLGRSAQNGLAGLVVLALINVLLVRFYPKSDEWERE